MALKDVIVTERTIEPPRVIIHGLHGIGKSTLGASTPAPIFLPTEDGLGEINVPHFPVITNYDTFIEYLSMLVLENHEYKTCVVDTLDWLEKLVWEKVCEEQGSIQGQKLTSIEDIGWSKGYIFALKHWDTILRGFNKLRGKGMIILLLAHNEIKTFYPPDGDNYDRYQIKIHHKAAGKLQEWADAVLFATYKVYVNKDTAKAQKGKGIGSGERILYTEERPAFKAKNRYSMPFEIPFTWESIVNNIIKPKQQQIKQPKQQLKQQIQQKEELL